MYKYLILICLLCVGCEDNHSGDTGEYYEVAGVQVIKWQSNPYVLEIKEKGKRVAISRTPEDWQRIAEKIYAQDIKDKSKPGFWKKYNAYSHIYILDNKLRYTIENTYAPTGDDSAFLYLYKENVDLRNKLNGVKVNE